MAVLLLARVLMVIIVFLGGGCHMPTSDSTSYSKSNANSPSIAGENVLPNFDKQWNYSEPAETENKFRQFLELNKAISNSSFHAQLLTQIARAQGLQQKFESAHGTLDEVEVLLADQMIAARVRYFLERGRVFNSAGDKEKAKVMFTQAWELASHAIDDNQTVGGEEEDVHGKAGVVKSKTLWAGPSMSFLAVDAAHMLGIVESPDIALQWNVKAIALAEIAKDADAPNWLGSLYNNTGWTYHEGGEFGKALVLFKKALEWHKEKVMKEGGVPEESTAVRVARWSVARCYRSLGRFDEALAVQRDLEVLQAKHGGNDGYIYEEIAELLLKKGKDAESTSYFGRAYNILSKDSWQVANEGERLNRLKQLGNE